MTMLPLSIWKKLFLALTLLVVANAMTDCASKTGISLLEENIFMFSLLVILATAILITFSWQVLQNNVHHFPLRLFLPKSVVKSSLLIKRYRNFAEAEIHGNEAERLRIARELHDDTIHRLVAIGHRMELLKFDHPGSELAAPMEELIHITNEGIDHIRGVIKELRPSHLVKKGLIQAINNLLTDRGEKRLYRIDFEVHGEEYRLNDATELTIYRLAQTALQNIRLHSKCSKVSIDLCYEEHGLMLKIEDDGIGFDVPEKAHLFEHAHFGLLGMKERAELCKGKFMIHSVKGAGTCVTLEIPKKGNL